MIGHLQSRKAEDVLPWASMVHSVDSVKLAQRLSRFCDSRTKLPILLEVNVSGEASKYGFRPEELPAAVEAIAALPGLALQGLMTMAPIAADPEEVRPVFAALRALRDELARRYPDARLAPPVDGHDRRLRSGDRRGRDDRARRARDFRRTDVVLRDE